jgi:hypothetical protein
VAGTLEKLALDCVRASPRDAQLAFAVLRDYIQRTPPARLLIEIKQIEDKRVFRHLIGAGLSAELLEAVMRRWRELER